MADTSSEPATVIKCPGCGSRQNKSRQECSRCGHPLHSPSQIYRREADGTWTPIKDIDLSTLAPKPIPPRRKLDRRKAAGIAALVLAGGALDFAFWRTRIRATRREVQERLSYINNPVGRIVPHFETHYLRNAAGELQITGQTNLPEETLLDVQVYSGPLLVAVDYPVSVRAGTFQTRPLLQRGIPFTPASYQLRIRASFGKRWQPPSVLMILGAQGERLDGPAIRRTDSNSEAKMEFTEDFVLNP